MVEGRRRRGSVEEEEIIFPDLDVVEVEKVAAEVQEGGEVQESDLPRLDEEQ